MAEFFFIVPVGLEELAFREIERKGLEVLDLKIAKSDVAFSKGGLEFSLEEFQGWAFNHLLKIPVRILQRVGQFKARDFPSLFNKVKKMNWSPYFRQSEIKVQVSARGSRLNIKNKIETTVREALMESQVAHPLRKPLLSVPQGLWVKIEQDKVILSVDSSGRPLYQRGGASVAHPAPLRENLGAALFFDLLLKEGQRLQKLDLIDPFCGTGTLLFEGAGFFCREKGPFAYENFPSSPSKRVTFSKIKDDAVFADAAGFDREPDFIEDCQKRAQQYHSRGLRSLNFHFEVSDFHSMRLAQWPKPFFLISNPPFGLRLSRKRDPLIDDLKRTFEHSLCQGMMLLWPQEQLSLWGSEWVWDDLLPTKQGGLSVVFAYKKKSE